MTLDEVSAITNLADFNCSGKLDYKKVWKTVILCVLDVMGSNGIIKCSTCVGPVMTLPQPTISLCSGTWLCLLVCISVSLVFSGRVLPWPFSLLQVNLMH